MTGSSTAVKKDNVVYLYPSVIKTKVPKYMESHVVAISPDIRKSIIRTLELTKYEHSSYDIVIKTDQRLVVRHRMSGNVYVLRDEE